MLNLYVLCLVAQKCPTLCDPMECSPPGSSVHGDSPGKNTGVGCHALPPGDLPSPETEPRSLTLQVDSLPSEPPGKPKNTGVGSLSLFQGIFPTQESNWGLLHCSMPHWRSIPDILPTVKGRDEGLLWRSRG